ncbi:MAG: hypothetical protein RJB28_574, partial [Actinomycetota bacterium]
MIKVNEFTDVKYDVSDSIATITINRPDRYNALRGRTVDELLAAFKYAWVDNSVGAIILTGAGEKAFCSGGDQKERAATGGYGETETGMFEIESLHKLIRAVPKPVIAAVNGHAIGVGFTLTLHCDLRFMARDAKYGIVQVRRGVMPDAMSHWTLPRLVGLANAADLLLTGRTFTGDEARELGVASRVLDNDDV